MAKISRPPAALPPAPAQYDQRAENEFRRLVVQMLSDPVEDLIRPSMSISVAHTATQYTIIVTYTGTMTYQIDGATAIAGTASPQTLVVDRQANGSAALVYAFSCVNAGQTTSENVTVLARLATAAPSITIGAQTADDGTDTYTYAWTTSGMPGGETYRLVYDFRDTAGTVLGIEADTIDPATSGGTVVSGVDIGASPTYAMTVSAWVGGIQIATRYGTGTFTT